MKKKIPERETNHAQRVFSVGSKDPLDNPFAALSKLSSPPPPPGSVVGVENKSTMQAATQSKLLQGYTVTIQRSSKGHGGKTVTTARCDKLTESLAKDWLTVWKKTFGVGGTIEHTPDGWFVQLQGDVRDRLEVELQKAGAKVKRSGG